MIKLATPGSAVRHASVARHVTDCAMQPGQPVDVDSCYYLAFDSCYYLADVHSVCSQTVETAKIDK